MNCPFPSMGGVFSASSTDIDCALADGAAARTMIITEIIYLSCLLILNITSFSVRPAESPGHDVDNVVSKLKRSSRRFCAGSYLSTGGLGEHPY